MALNEMLKHDRQLATAWAAAALADEAAVILDTETTGHDEEAEIVEIAIISIRGETLFQSLVRPRIKMGGTHIHGITAEDVAGTPTWLELNARLLEIAKAASRIIVYNADYDRRLVYQTQESWRVGYPLEPMESWESLPWRCAMKAYAAFAGQWDEYHKSYKWQKLTAAALHFGADTSNCHRALGDAQMTLEVIRGMARLEVQDV